MASGIDMKAGSVLTWTSISSRASSAIHSSVAATAAIGSPTYRTFSRASASSSWLTGRMPNFTGRSSPVMTASTPGSARARLVSTLRIRACGWGLRRIRPYTIRRGAELGEGDLQGMRIAAPCHAFHRHDVAALQVEGPRQAGEVRFAIDQHAAGRALAQLAAMLGAGESQVFAKNFEQRFVGQHHDRHVLAVDPQADGNLVRDRHAPTLEGLDR